MVVTVLTVGEERRQEMLIWLGREMTEEGPDDAPMQVTFRGSTSRKNVEAQVEILSLLLIYL